MSSLMKRPLGVQLESTGKSTASLTATLYGDAAYAVEVRVEYLRRDESPVSNVHTTHAVQMTTFRGNVRPEFSRRIGSSVFLAQLALPLDPNASAAARRIGIKFAITSPAKMRTAPLFMVRQKCDMALSERQPRTYGFPVSNNEVESRLTWLFANYRCLSGDSDAATDATTILWKRLRGGFDTPLLDFDPEVQR